MRYLGIQRNELLTFITVFAVALAVRVIFVFQWNSTPYGSILFLDAQFYDEWARAIAHGQFLYPRAFYTSPLYPYVLGIFYLIFGHSLLCAGLLNAIMGALTAMILTIVACVYFGLEAAAITGFLAIFYRPFIFYSAPILKESLLLLLLALSLAFAMQALKRNKSRDMIGCGAMLGICALARGNVLFLAPAILALGFLKWQRGFLKNSILFVVTMLLCIAPATLHNYIVSGDFVPLNYNGGFNFYVGNSLTANGSNGYPPEISTDPLGEELGTIAETREAKGRNVSPSEVSAYWRQRALDFILHNPLQDLLLLKNKFLGFWNNAAAFDSYDIQSFKNNFDTLISAPLVSFWLITSLAAFGTVAAWTSRREEVINLVIFTLTYMAAVLLFYVTDRYQLPVVIFLLPLAGAAVPMGIQLLQRKTWVRLVAASVLAFFFLFLGLRPAPIQEPSEELGVETLVRSSFLEESHGHGSQAEHLLNAAIQLYPRNGVVEYQYGRLKALQNDLPEALAAFQKASVLAPHYVLSYYEEAGIDLRLGDKVNAVKAMQRGLAANPSDPFLQQELIQISKSP